MQQFVTPHNISSEPHILTIVYCKNAPNSLVANIVLLPVGAE